MTNNTLLFRGKKKDKDQWVFGYYVVCDERSFIVPRPVECDTCKHMYDGYWLGTFYEVIRETVCQFTGVKDKHGIYIYGGDIVKNLHRNNDLNYDVVWDTQLAAFIVRNPTDNSWDYLGSGKWEVVGDIFNNADSKVRK